MLTPSASARLLTQLESLTLLLADASPAAITRRPTSGKWSAHENLAHLARYHEIFLERLRRILREDRPQLARYRAEDDPEWPGWAELSTEEVLKRIHTLRRDLIALIQSLSPDQLARAGVHPALGPMDIPLWIEFFLLHEAHHFYVVMQRVRASQ
jgi:uncharacterized damage-inducible protein DinB